jgi:hypothetical protein
MFSIELQQLCNAALRASVSRWNIIIDSGTVSSLSLCLSLSRMSLLCACVHVCVLCVVCARACVCVRAAAADMTYYCMIYYCMCMCVHVCVCVCPRRIRLGQNAAATA